MPGGRQATLWRTFVVARVPKLVVHLHQETSSTAALGMVDHTVKINKPEPDSVYMPSPPREHQGRTFRAATGFNISTTVPRHKSKENQMDKKKEDSLYGQTLLALQQPRLALLERLARELRLLPDGDLVARDDHREHGHALRLAEPASDAPTGAAAERQERVARVVAQEALRLERLGLVPVLRWWGQWASDRRRREREARGDVRLLCSPGVCTVT